jgi:hydroxymethylbilane synthase
VTAPITLGTVQIGTRASLLAKTQTQLVADALTARGVEVEIVEISTLGDRSQAANTPIAQTGVGVFTSALREALLEGRIDVAVHSYKDLPTAGLPGIVLAAVPQRADPRDVLVARDQMVLGELPPGSVIGTGSPRRTAQLHALGLGLQVVGIRGNVETRIRKVTEGEVDGVILARAGLARIGRAGEATEVLDPLQMLPAPAQGALAVECRVADTELETFLRSTLHDESTCAAVTAERAVLADLGSPCNAAIGALADVVEDLDDDGHVVEALSLRAFATTAEGALVRASVTGETKDAEQLGRTLAQELLADGADPNATG